MVERLYDNSKKGLEIYDGSQKPKSKFSEGDQKEGEAEKQIQYTDPIQKDSEIKFGSKQDDKQKDLKEVFKAFGKELGPDYKPKEAGKSLAAAFGSLKMPFGNKSDDWSEEKKQTEKETPGN